MDKDQQIVQEADLALVSATKQYLAMPAWDRPKVQPSLDKARSRWAAARYRLLFPDSIAVQADLEQARLLRGNIDNAANQQALVQALLDLGGLLVKFAH